MKRLAFACVAVVLLAGCSKEGTPLTQPTPTQTASRPASTATLSIEQPKQGRTYPPTSIPVELKLRGGRLLDEASQNITPDTGHIHIELDGATFYQASGLGLKFDLAKVKTSEKSGDRTPIAPGAYLLRFEFVAADHVPFNPRVIQAVQITVA